MTRDDPGGEILLLKDCTTFMSATDRFVIIRESDILYTLGDRVIGKRVMAIQYALLSLGTGVISSSQVHDMFHTVHTCIPFMQVYCE